MSKRRIHRPFLGLLGAFGLSGLVGFAMVAAASSADPRFEPAQPDQATYELSNLRVTYPYVGPVPGGDEQPDPHLALVTYDAVWSGDAFPGTAQCRLTALDSKGIEVGEVFFHLTAVEPAAADAAQQLAVSSAPASAVGVCEQGSYPADASYSFDEVATEDAAGGAAVWATVRWVGAYPSVRSCEARVNLADGTVKSLPFSLDVGDGERVPIVLLAEDSAAEVSEVEVTCGPVTAASAKP
jgi:hypothetical protein